MSDYETKPMPLDPFGKKTRQLVRFDPTLSTGSLLQIGLWLGGMVIGYGAYQADKAKDRMEVEQIKVDATAQRAAVRESISELRTDVKDVQRSLIDLNQSMAVLKARSEPQMQDAQSGKRGAR